MNDWETRAAYQREIEREGLPWPQRDYSNWSLLLLVIVLVLKLWHKWR